MNSAWQQIVRTATDIRQELHAHPELGWCEERTAARIRSLLTDLDIPWRACADTGTVAYLGGKLGGKSGPRPRVALRADIDALPISEDTGKPYTSCFEGTMHACGHDGHTATLLAASHWIKQHEDQLPGPVTLIFQPAEEGGHGARRMIEDGALEGVSEIYGWHNWPAIAFGRMACPDDIVMCGNGTFEIAVNGRGGHASQPELCRDPVLAGSAIVQALQQIIARNVAPQRASVVSVTSFDAPSGPTVIPQRAVLGGSIRVSDEASRELINTQIREISQHIAKGYGVSADVEIFPRYQATINHPTQAGRLRELWERYHGEGSLQHDISLPVMASEDFSYYLREIPGAFALVGSADDDATHQHPCHSPHYDFNDRLIPEVSRLFCQLAGVPLP